MSGMSRIVEEFSKETNPQGHAQLDASLVKMNGEVTEKENILKELLALEQKATSLEKTIANKKVGFFEKMKTRSEYKKLRDNLTELSLIPKLFSGDLSKALTEHISHGENKIAYLHKDIETAPGKFAADERRRYADHPYTEEDIKNIFSEENLCKISLDEYADILSRFPNGMITHVTRQGVRDHSGLAEHKTGLGEFHHGFTGMLGDGGLLSTVGAYAKQFGSAEAVVFDRVDGYELPKIEKQEWKNKEKTHEEVLAEFSTVSEAMYAEWCANQEGKTWVETCKERFPDLADYNPPSVHKIQTRGEILYNMHQERKDPTSVPKRTAFPPICDRISVHFGVDHVMDGYYGAETGNECFIVFPQMMVNANYDYSGSLYQKTGISTHNDLAVYPKTNNGMPIEAGIIFLPKDANVDKETGSKYKTENGVPILADETPDGKESYILADNTVSSQEYWQQYLGKNAGDKNLKVVYYDTDKEPTKAVSDWLTANTVSGEKSQERKKEEHQNKFPDQIALSQTEQVTRLRNAMERLVDFRTLETRINAHFDELEKDPFAFEWLQKRQAYVLNELDNERGHSIEEKRQFVSNQLGNVNGTNTITEEKT